MADGKRNERIGATDAKKHCQMTKKEKKEGIDSYHRSSAFAPVSLFYCFVFVEYVGRLICFLISGRGIDNIQIHFMLALYSLFSFFILFSLLLSCVAEAGKKKYRCDLASSMSVLTLFFQAWGCTVKAVKVGLFAQPCDRTDTKENTLISGPFQV